MQTRHAAEAIAPRVWRDLAALAAEAVAIGVLVQRIARTRGPGDDARAAGR